MDIARPCYFYCKCSVTSKKFSLVSCSPCIFLWHTYPSSVTKKQLYRDLVVNSVLPVPLNRSIYNSGSEQDVLKWCLSRLRQSFFFNFTQVLSQLKPGWRKKDYSLRGVWIVLFVGNSNHWVCLYLLLLYERFFWDILQSTLKEDFHLDPHTIRLHIIENKHGVPFDVTML